MLWWIVSRIAISALISSRTEASWKPKSQLLGGLRWCRLPGPGSWLGPPGAYVGVAADAHGEVQGSLRKGWATLLAAPAALSVLSAGRSLSEVPMSLQSWYRKHMHQVR